MGSSASRTLGPLIRARAMATRWRSPPDSSLGRCLSRSPRPSALQQLDRPVGGPAPAARASPATPVPVIWASMHVFQHVQLRQQVVELEDEADVARTACGRAGGRPASPSSAPSRMIAALVGPVQQAHQVQQRALAAAGGPDDGHELARAARPGSRRAARAGPPCPCGRSCAARRRWMAALTHIAGPPPAASAPPAWPAGSRPTSPASDGPDHHDHDQPPRLDLVGDLSNRNAWRSNTRQPNVPADPVVDRVDVVHEQQPADHAQDAARPARWPPP